MNLWKITTRSPLYLMLSWILFNNLIKLGKKYRFDVGSHKVLSFLLPGVDMKNVLSISCNCNINVFVYSKKGCYLYPCPMFFIRHPPKFLHSTGITFATRRLVKIIYESCASFFCTFLFVSCHFMDLGLYFWLGLIKVG